MILRDLLVRTGMRASQSMECLSKILRLKRSGTRQLELVSLEDRVPVVLRRSVMGFFRQTGPLTHRMSRSHFRFDTHSCTSTVCPTGNRDVIAPVDHTNCLPAAKHNILIE